MHTYLSQLPSDLLSILLVFELTVLFSRHHSSTGICLNHQAATGSDISLCDGTDRFFHLFLKGPTRQSRHLQASSQITHYWTFHPVWFWDAFSDIYIQTLWSVRRKLDQIRQQIRNAWKSCSQVTETELESHIHLPLLHHPATTYDPQWVRWGGSRVVFAPQKNRRPEWSQPNGALSYVVHSSKSVQLLSFEKQLCEGEANSPRG